MKKGSIGSGIVSKVDFPNKGRVIVVKEDGTQETVTVKNTIPGQEVSFRVNKNRKNRSEGALLEVIKKSPEEVEAPCPHFGVCGGCTFLSLPYEEETKLKESQVRDILGAAVRNEETDWFEGIKGSPDIFEYRNKMEFSFGDEYMNGPLALGMHKRGSFYDIVTVEGCRLVHPDFLMILKAALKFFSDNNTPYYHRVRHEGVLRHMIVRRGVKSKEILVDLVTTTQEAVDFDGFVKTLTNLSLEGKIAGILHTKNDSVADAVIDEGTEVLYGKEYFNETLLGLNFKITPFSFFQTNSKGAEVLYETVREYALSIMDKEADDKPVVFDLYSGTGTIAQLLSAAAKKVVGIEIIGEAVEAAKLNASSNGISNCEFYAGDVLKVVPKIQDKPDIIVVDPPRDGCHPKALPQIIDFGAPYIIYISCKVTSLARDLEMLQDRGYKVEKAVAVDQFPWTGNVEVVTLLSKSNRKADSSIKLSLDMDE